MHHAAEAVDVSPASLVVVGIGVGFIALSNVIVKAIPPGHPLPANALGMAIGASLLLALDLLTGEPVGQPGAQSRRARIGS